MKNIIEQISDNFIAEALASPRMLEDLAAMEKYMSESYDGRTFVELLQNADDAESCRVKVFLVGDTLVVANDGRPFNESDIMAICRSGASSKQRGNNIGYRGVGFKSATTISTEIVIHSAEVYFTFSKSICAKHLEKNVNEVPTVRIPFLYDSNVMGETVNKAIRECKDEGFTTFFIFNKANVDKFLNELEGFSSGWLLFLRNISTVYIECGSLKKRCAITRKTVLDNDIVLSVNGSNEQWYIVSNDNVSIAFRYDSVDGIIPCGHDEAVYHCFLPTLDKTGFPFKVNADFSTDPSRKHIIQDESTSKAIDNVQRLFVDTVHKLVHRGDERFYNILSLINMHTTLNALVTQLEMGIFERLRIVDWVLLNNGQYVKPESAKTFPKWFDSVDREQFRQKTSTLVQNVVHRNLLNRVEKLETILSKLGAKEITIRELLEILMNIDYVQMLSAELLGKIFVHCYRTISDEQNIMKIFVPLENGYAQLSETSSETKLNVNFIDTIKKLLNSREVEALSINYEVFSVLQKRTINVNLLKKASEVSEDKMAKTATLAINKWKTPIQNCMAVETINGNSVKDVSRKCDEYSIVSTDKEGNVSYIAVKNVGVLGDSFKLTESEYAAAQQFGDSYKVYLFTTDTSNIKYMVVVNPIDTVQMKKVVKEWEWICDSYESNRAGFDEREEADLSIAIIETVDFDKMDGQEFERFCAKLLMKNGYEDVSLTKTSGDQGIDIIAYRDGIKFGIQCKCYSSNIGNSAVQEVFAGKSYYKCNIGIVLTNQHFSASAIQLAENNGVVLWGREELLRLIKNAM